MADKRGERGELFVVSTYAISTHKYQVRLLKLRVPIGGGYVDSRDIEEIVEILGPFEYHSEEAVEAKKRLRQKRDLLNTPLGGLIWELRKNEQR